MKINISFSALEAAVQKMNPGEIVKFEVTQSLEARDPVDISLGVGLEVDITDVEVTAGLLSYKGRQVLLYIRDHGTGVRKALDDGSSGRKYHLADCKVLQGMREKGRFERYVVTNDTSEQFLVTGYDRFTNEQLEGSTDLKVCKTCLNHLNYKGYQSGGNRTDIFSKFTMDEFFSTYSSHFEFMPSRNAEKVDDGYTKDWSIVSSNYKASKSYTCESCHVTLDKFEHKRLLHTHHVNGVKSDNRTSNLKALCADCHSKQRFHEHMFVPRNDKQTIIELRKKQTIIRSNNSWQELFDYSDSAVHGVLHLCQQRRTEAPEVGVDIVNTASEIIGSAELAWRNMKVAVVLNDEEKDIVSSVGWKVFKTDEFIQQFNLGFDVFRR
ncbi:HNH endonuclease [Vibrio maritimus]|uniref:HNH endonuclease n=1 Tax=Vibrio maritimus TaxID=990268 RepID=UPI0037366815